MYGWVLFLDIVLNVQKIVYSALANSVTLKLISEKKGQVEYFKRNFHFFALRRLIHQLYND